MGSKNTVDPQGRPPQKFTFGTFYTANGESLVPDFIAGKMPFARLRLTMAERVRHWLHRQPMLHQPAGLICRALHCTSAWCLSPPVSRDSSAVPCRARCNSLRAKPCKKILPGWHRFCLSAGRQRGRSTPERASTGDTADVGQWACVGYVEPRRKEVRTEQRRRWETGSTIRSRPLLNSGDLVKEENDDARMQ